MNARNRLPSLTLLGGLVVLLVAITGRSSPAAGPVVLADVAHAASPEERTVLDETPAGFSRFWKALASRAGEVRIGRGPLTPEGLDVADVLVVTTLAPDKPFSAGEIEAVRQFVTRGGVLLLATSDLSREGLDAWVGLAARFGIQSHGSVLRLSTPGQAGRAHVSRYSGAGLVRWLPGVEDAWLYYDGTSAAPRGGEVLLHYNGNTLASRRQIGTGWVYALGGGDLISNAFAGEEEPGSGLPIANTKLTDALAAEIVEPPSVK